MRSNRSNTQHAFCNTFHSKVRYRVYKVISIDIINMDVLAKYETNN